MSRLRFRISISLDGYTAGPGQSASEPMGMGGMRLHEWVFPLDSWRSMQGLGSGEKNASDTLVHEWRRNIGATVMGRNMFGGHPGPWDAKKPWNGWWGDEPPFHHPVFVITHHAREPLVLGETTFHFVTDGIESALAQARRAAKGKDVSLGGGASTARQYLAAGFVDEMDLSVVPVLLGAGERLLEGFGTDLHGLTFRGAVAAPGVTHLRFARD
jgi:dihydrofolate reductase